ncbi:XdhC family protein [Poseidonibacter antarcticus]|uniref:XdhC family protein n=1 Tax=Poseidonibacter antarcticus TaxID=2478538 RepID=UPI000EF45DD1|nr:XdhC/CoxI family protein [Poseidonibacter antarcticus]
MFCNKEYLKFIESSRQKGLDIVGASVIQTLGSTYSKAGNMILINSNEEFIGVLGSPSLHNKIYAFGKEVLQSRESLHFENTPKDKKSGHGISRYLIQPFFYAENYGALGISLDNIGKTLSRSIKDFSFEIIDESIETKLENERFYQTIQKPYSLLIFGSGSHVTSLISMANLMAWETTVIDREIKEEYVNEADNLIKLENLKDILSYDLSSYNAAVILSHCPNTDDTYLEALLDSNVEYIGILGNKKNMQKKREQFNLQDDKRYFAPVGFDIGGNTHQSIALSICAQIEARKNGKI